MIEKWKPNNLVHQQVIFLLSILVSTSGGVIETTAVLTTGLVQGGTASPALFRYFIDDLAGELREGQGKSRTATGEILDDPGKLVADDVILVADTQEDMQSFLVVYTRWARHNELQ